MTVIEIWDKLPFEFLQRIEANAFFCDIVVVVAEEGDVVAEIARKQALIKGKGGKIGAAVIINQLEADDDQPNLKTGPMTLFPSFHVVEHLELNRGTSGTGKSARKIARYLKDLIKTGDIEGFIADLAPANPCIEALVLSEAERKVIKGFQVNFRALECGSDVMRAVAPPTFAQVPGEAKVALACSTAGATIYWTADDSYPRPPAAQVYSEPIDASSTITIRACAFADGMLESRVVRRTITLE